MASPDPARLSIIERQEQFQQELEIDVNLFT